MPKINVYLSDSLAASVREAQIPVSAVCQIALERAVSDVTALRASDQASTAEVTFGPFGRFTPRANKVMTLATEHAKGRLGTEHLLLGVIDEGTNLALKVLTSLDVEPADVRSELLASMEAGSGRAPGSGSGSSGGGRTGAAPGDTPFTPLYKEALEAATKEALTFGHNYIGCEHLLLGVLATEDGLGSQVLRRMGVELRTTRRAVVTALSGLVHAREQGTGGGGSGGDASSTDSATATALDAILRRIEAIEQRLADDAD